MGDFQLPTSVSVKGKIYATPKEPKKIVLITFTCSLGAAWAKNKAAVAPLGKRGRPTRIDRSFTAAENRELHSAPNVKSSLNQGRF